MMHRAFADVVRVYRRHWVLLATMQLVAGIALGLVAWGLLWLATQAAQSLISWLTVDGALSPGPVMLFGLVMAALFALLGLPVLIGAVVVVIGVTDDELAGRRAAPFRWAATGLVFTPTIAATIALGCAVLFLLFVGAPAIFVLAIVALAVTPVVRLIRRRRPGFLAVWPSVRVLLFCLIPFGLAAHWFARVLLALPVVAIERRGIIDSLRVADRLARSRRVFVVVSLLVAWLVPVLVGAGISLLGSLAGADLGAQIGQIVSQLLLSSLPLVVLAVVYRVAAGSPTLARAQAPARSRRRIISLTPGLLRRVATIMPGVLVITAVGFAQVPAASAATSGAPVVLIVTSSSDSTDVATLATQQQNCLDGSGECTLRAALTAAEVLSVSGSTDQIHVSFAVDTTVHVTAGSPLAFNNSNVSGGEGQPGTTGTITIDGLGHAVALDGGGTTQVLSFFSHSWNVVVRGLELRGGNASSLTTGQGGGLYIGGTRSALVDTVSFHDDTAIAGGGLYAGTTTTVQNSTFVSNSLAPADGNTTPGGADLFSGATVTAVNNTFGGTHGGGSIFNWGGPGYTLSLSNSLIAESPTTSQGGGDNCSGGGITGVSNIVSRLDGTCPGAVQSTGDFLAPLARVSPGYPPVRVLLPSTVGTPNSAFGAGTAACPPTDARGIARSATGCDAGAYEFNPVTTTTLSSSLNPSEYGDSVAVTAAVASRDEAAAVVGSVQFAVNGVDFGAPVVLSAGLVSTVIHPVAAGDYTVTADFIPARPGGFSASSAPSLTQVVAVSGSPVQLQSNHPSVLLGDPVEFTIGVGDGAQQITGEVNLLDVTNGAPGTVIGTATLTGSNIATITTSSLAAGVRSLVADYSGDTNNAAGRSTAISVSVLLPSSTTIHTDVSTAVFGSPVAVTAAVTGAGPTPSGTVTFTSAGVVLGSATLAGGSAELTVSALDVGAHEIVARFEGDGAYAQSNSAGATVTISRASTSTVLADPGTVSFGYPTVLTATVTNTASGSTADPSGVVTFTAGGSELGSATLVGNADGTSTASYTTAVGDLPIGAVAVQASFSAGSTGNFTASTSAEGTATVVAASTSVEVRSDATPSPFGRPIQLIATVGATGGSLATPTGTVRFTEGATVLGTAPLIGGVATLGYSGFARGSHLVEAAYLGASEFEQSNGEAEQTVSTDTTTTTLTPSVTTSVYGQSVHFAVRVTGSGGGLPSGTVVLRDGTTDIATLPLIAGMASVTLADLGAGAHQLHAVFAGDGDYLASDGEGDVTITAATTSTVLQLSTTDSVFGRSVTLLATVSNTNALSTLPPHGSVRFSTQGGLDLGTVPLTIADGVSSTVSLVTTALPQTSSYPGSEIGVIAEFVPDAANFSGSTDTQAIRVAQGTTAISLVVTPGTVSTDAVAIATITVTSGVGAPTGTVRFIAADTIVDVPVVDGTAVSPGLRLPRGQRNVMAVYTSGDSNFLAGGPGVSNTAGVIVDTGAGLPVIGLTRSNTGTMAFGAPNTLSATVIALGPTATGTVTFVATGAQGTTPLGTTALAGTTAQLTTTMIPVGTQTLTASYSGDYNYSVVSSSPLTQIVVAAETTTTVTASQEPSAVLVPVVYSAKVLAVTGAIPSGTVDFTLGGVVLASSALNAAGVASATSTPRAQGNVNVVAVFTPSDGSVTGSTGALAHTVAALPTSVELTSSTSRAGVGESVVYTVSVTPSPFNLVTDALPTGTVTISDGEGNECEAQLTMGGSQPGQVLAECSLAWNAVGSHLVTAVYAGDDLYAGAAPRGQNIAVGIQAPDVTLTTSTDRAWVGGETTRLFWSVRGPVADDTIVSIWGLGRTLCTSTALEGSCDVAFPRSFSGAASFTFVYPGNAAWSAKSVQLDQNVTECVPFSAPTVVPVGAGTAAADAAPNCAGGTGYLPGTVVQYSVTPNPGYTFNSWSRGSTLVATAGSGVNNQANFSTECVAVRYSTLGPASIGGQMRVTPEPNCGPQAQQGWSYEPGGVTVGSYSPGTVLTLTATVPFGTKATNRLYSWLGLKAGEDATSETTTITLDAGEPRRIYASFGVVCNHGISFPTPANGTAKIGPTNCTDPDGAGYIPGSTVPVSTTATGSAFFAGWSSSQMLSSIKSTATGSTASLLVPDGPVELKADYGTCVRIDLAVEGRNAQNTPLGAATASPTGTCPTLGDGWYKPGSFVDLTATGVRGATFVGWAGLPDARLASRAATTVQVGETGSYTARFANLYKCSTISMKSVPAGAFDLSLSFPDGKDTCPDGQYDPSLGTNQYGTTLIRVTATPKTAAAKSAMSGWTGTTQLPASASAVKLANRSLTSDLYVYGDTQLTAWSCVAIDPTLTLVSPNGTAHTTPAPTNADFINVDPAPNCGLSTMAFTTGSRVSVLANAPTAGYSFTGWTGALTSSAAYPTTPLVLDGSSPSVPITANYTVICHTLTTNFDNVKISPAPNCPDKPASAHSYIGGTSVALQAMGDGNLVFRGWNGPTIFSDDTFAGVNMTADVALYANYTSMSVGEHITDIASTVGDTLAITAKKATGVAAAIATTLIAGGNPISTAVGLVSLLGQAVGGVATLLGVDSAGLRSFQSVVAGIAATMSFMTAFSSCATEWSMGANGKPPASETTAEDLVAGGYNVYAGLTGAIEGPSAAADLAQGKKLGARLGAVVTVGTGLFNMATQGTSGGWDSSAASAWTTGGDTYMNCFARSMPGIFD